MTSKNFKKDDDNTNNEESDYKNLVFRLIEIKRTISLLENKLSSIALIISNSEAVIISLFLSLFSFTKSSQIFPLLTFPSNIATSFEIIYSRGKKKDFFIEFDKVWIHGFLHLLGYDHIKNQDYFKMIKVEKRILDLI